MDPNLCDFVFAVRVRQGDVIIEAKYHLCHQELCDPLRKSAFLTGQDHLQHVSMKLLHDHKHSLWCLKHTVQVDHPWMMQALKGQERSV